MSSVVNEAPAPVTEPLAAMLFREISESRATDTSLVPIVVVTLAPPETLRTSDERSMLSLEPLSPPTARVVVIAAVEVAVTRPLASTVRTGIAVAEPTDPADTPESASLAAASVPEAMLSALRAVRFTPDTAGSVAGNLASGTVPEARSEASRLVRFAPLIAGSVAGNLPSGTVPEES